MVNSATMKSNLLADGASERGSVYSIVMWQLLTAASLLPLPWLAPLRRLSRR
jgi:hypothetical protein